MNVADIGAAIAEIKSTLRLHTWILTTNTAGILAIIGLLLRAGSLK